MWSQIGKEGIFSNQAPEGEVERGEVGQLGIVPRSLSHIRPQSHSSEVLNSPDSWSGEQL